MVVLPAGTAQKKTGAEGKSTKEQYYWDPATHGSPAGMKGQGLGFGQGTKTGAVWRASRGAWQRGVRENKESNNQVNECGVEKLDEALGKNTKTKKKCCVACGTWSVCCCVWVGVQAGKLVVWELRGRAVGCMKASHSAWHPHRRGGAKKG